MKEKSSKSSHFKTWKLSIFGIFALKMSETIRQLSKQLSISYLSITSSFQLYSQPFLPCWLPWRWSLVQQARWSPAPTGSGCRSEATPPPPCRSETHLGKSVGAGLRIIHSGHISSADRLHPTRGPDSRNRTAPTRPAETCWGPWRRRWARRWSSCAARITP